MGCLEGEKKRIFCGDGYRESRLAYLTTDGEYPKVCVNLQTDVR